MSDYIDDYDEYEDYEANGEQAANRRDELIDKLQDRVERTNAALFKEEELRKQHPSLQNVWEQYQIILKTVRE